MENHMKKVWLFITAMMMGLPAWAGDLPVEARIEQAMREKWAYTRFLLMLFEDEISRRDQRQLGLRLTEAVPQLEHARFAGHRHVAIARRVFVEGRLHRST